MSFLKTSKCRFVRLEYLPCYSQDQLLQEFTNVTQRAEDNQFVEALAFSKDTSVLMIGNMTSSAEPEKVRYRIQGGKLLFIYLYHLVSFVEHKG